MSKRIGNAAAFLVGTLAAFSCCVTPRPRLDAAPRTPGAASAEDDFIHSPGMALVWRGAPFRFIGYNLPYLFARWEIPSCTWGFVEGRHFNAKEQLDRFEGLGIGVIRAWAFQRFAMAGEKLDFTHFDDMIAMAKQHGIKIVMTIANGIPSCEPSNAQKPLEWYSAQPSFSGSPYYKTQIEPGYALTYRDYALALAERYKDEPAVAWWELLNEPEPIDSKDGSCSEVIPNGTGAAQALRQFADDMVDAIKSKDRHHLVSLGAYGSEYQCGQHAAGRGEASYCADSGLGCRSDLEFTQAGKIDLISIHDYASLYPNAVDKMAFYSGVSREARIDLDAAARLRKPVYFGEVGMTVQPIAPYCTKYEDAYPAAICGSRASCFDRKLGALYASTPPIAGVLIWQAVSGPSGCYDVGRGGGSADLWDPLDQVVEKYSGPTGASVPEN